MTLLRRLAYASVALAFLHIVFGAIVRITGSGMGCGDHWPTCYGYWIPPFSRPDLVIEVTHRYLALLLLAAIAALAIAAWLRRRDPGVGGRGGVLRAAGLALLLWVAPALLGALTVVLGNPPSATVAHKALAAALLAVLAAAAVRAGGFGARGLAGVAVSGRARRGAIAAAALAIVVVLLGGLTAKLPGAAVACAGFPLCTETSGPPGLAHVQLTHRVLAYLLALHLVGQAIGFTRRREPRPLLVASRVTLALVVLQIALAGHMVLGGFPAAIRSAHQATGMALWLTTFLVAYLAGFRGDRTPARAASPDPLAVPGPARTLGVVAPESVAPVTLAMAKLGAEESPPEPEPDPEGAAAESAALVAEQLVVEDTAAFAEALERAVEAAAEPEGAPDGESPTVETPSAEQPSAEQPGAEQPGAESPTSKRRPLRLSMAVIVARGADL